MLARTLTVRPVAPARRAVRAAAAEDSRINKTIDLGSPKVSVCVGGRRVGRWINVVD